VVGAQIEVDELRKKLGQMNTGIGAGANDPRVFVPFKQIPDLGAEYIRRFRDVEIQYKILQFITPLYEQAKVEENRQTPSVLVLDRAGPAERKAKPKVTLYALVALVASIMVSFVVVFTLELIAKLKAKHPERFDQMVSAMRSDWFGLRLRRMRP
jgi:tyrosine-protein kinase Etk/Wzc